MPALVVLAPPLHGAHFSLNQQHDVIIGREGYCDIVLPKRTISRKHARVFFEGNRFKIEDLSSSHGTFLNGRRVDQPLNLKDGDHINIYDVPIAYVEILAESLSQTLSWSQEATDDFTLPTKTTTTKPTPDSHVAGHGRLRDLLEITRCLGSSLDLDQLYPRVLDTLFRMFPQAVLGEIQLSDAQGRLIPVAMKHGRCDDSTAITRVPASNDYVAYAVNAGQPLLKSCDTALTDSVLDEIDSSLICVPIIGPSRTKLGAVFLETEDSTRNFTKDDLELVVAVGVMTGQAIEYAQAHQALLRLDHTQQQLETARQIQLRMLPKKHPNVAGYRFHEHYAPAETVGGDYYFIDSLPDSRVVLGVADACGKALPAAIMIAQFATEVRHVIAAATTLKRAMSSINRFVFDLDEGFITFCLCVLNVKKHTLTIANAGHLAPLLRQFKTGAMQRLQGRETNYPLGLVPEEEFHPFTVELEPGDEVLLFTDGITEAMSPDNQQYGLNRLEVMAATSQCDLKARVATIVADVDRFRRGRRPSDDCCLVAFSRNEPASGCQEANSGE